MNWENRAALYCWRLVFDFLFFVILLTFLHSLSYFFPSSFIIVLSFYYFVILSSHCHNKSFMLVSMCYTCTKFSARNIAVEPSTKQVRIVRFIQKVVQGSISQLFAKYTKRKESMYSFFFCLLFLINLNPNLEGVVT